MGGFRGWPRALRPPLFLWFFKCYSHPFLNFLDPPLPFAVHEYPSLHFPSLYVGQGFQISYRIRNDKTDQSQSNFYEWNCVIQFSTNPAELHSLFSAPVKDHDFPRPWKKLSPGWLFPSRDKALSYFLLRNVPRMQNNVKKDTLHRRSIMRVKCFAHRLSHDCHFDIDRNINININFWRNLNFRRVSKWQSWNKR